MNSSSSGAAMAPAPAASPYQYCEAEGYDPAATPAEKEQAVQEKTRRQQSEAFDKGREPGRQEVRIEFDAALARERQNIAAALQAFTIERQTYYRRIEGEVVQLALAIARKILHRETELDPNALKAIVRVTLEKLDAGTKVNLHVPPRDAADWRHYFACQAEGGTAPEVHEDAALPAGECRIETSLGTTLVGFESQLKEIETGLLDLLAERPGGPAPPDQPPK
jgi:flagellar assembly protein FliH